MPNFSFTETNKKRRKKYMAMNVEILIKGLAACYREGNFWKVVFICDGIHPVNFLVHGEIHEQSPLQREFSDRNISFTGVSDSPLSTGPAFNSIFNMAAEDYAHGHDKLKLARNGSTKVISMLIPSAILDTYCLTRRKYFVQEDRRGAPVRIIDRVAAVISAKFDVTAMPGLTMIIKEKGVDDIPVHFPFVDGTKLTLTFDNDCGEFCHENDFYLYYDLVKDKTKKKLMAGQVLNSHMIRFSSTAKIGNLVTDTTIPICDDGSDPSPDLGNCDPVVIEPPPTPLKP
ncbi:MAG TPA: hypothetical protein VF571_16445 [Pyrinomonadaceae bacterium]|jgi:hypothetical protein